MRVLLLRVQIDSKGMVGDPIYELNFKNGTLWNDYVWEYVPDDSSMTHPLRFWLTQER